MYSQEKENLNNSTIAGSERIWRSLSVMLMSYVWGNYFPQGFITKGWPSCDFEIKVLMWNPQSKSVLGL